MELVIDTREQLSYSPILNRLSIKHQIKCLNVGDYSLAGYEHLFSLERKSLADFIHCVTRDRQRFVKELERAKQLDYFAIIIEGSYYDIKNKNYRSNTNPKAILNSIFKWSASYGFPIFLVDSREGGALAVIKLCEYYLKCHQNGQ